MCCWKNSCVLCDDTGKGALKANAWFPQNSLRVSLPFASCALLSSSTAVSTTRWASPGVHAVIRPGLVFETNRTPGRSLHSVWWVDTLAQAGSESCWSPGAAQELPSLPPRNRKIRKSLRSSPKRQTGNHSDAQTTHG